MIRAPNCCAVAALVFSNSEIELCVKASFPAAFFAIYLFSSEKNPIPDIFVVLFCIISILLRFYSMDICLVVAFFTFAFQISFVVQYIPFAKTPLW